MIQYISRLYSSDNPVAFMPKLAGLKGFRNYPDLTVGVAFPMFPANTRPIQPPSGAVLADNPLDFHESCRCRVAFQGEDDQQVSWARLRGIGLLWSHP